VCVCVCVCGAGDQTQGLTYALQVLHHQAILLALEAHFAGTRGRGAPGSHRRVCWACLEDSAGRENQEGAASLADGGISQIGNLLCAELGRVSDKSWGLLVWCHVRLNSV
jgi:hypothetical protein